MISDKVFESRLDHARASACGELPGLFGPGSMTWRVDREAAVFLGAGRALLLQLAHPWVASSIAQHSDTLHRPVARFHRTFRAVYTMVFGTTGDALDAARRLHRRHAAVTGELPASAGRFTGASRYHANDEHALRWVHATLVDSALAAYTLILPPLSDEDRERYWSEARLFAALFGIDEASLPSDWNAFAAYTEEMLNSDVLAVTPEARQIAAALLGGKPLGFAMPRWYRAITAELLPKRVRDEFGYSLDDRERRRAETAVSRLRRVYRVLPGSLRYVAPYHEACSRIAGRSRPGVMTQVLNRLWIGRRTLSNDLNRGLRTGSAPSRSRS